ncbi:hypothetical protein I4U23_007099 [Adineta vaga]|nr:hypothetical protein I4U23_007099 [Adineta vaga]
MFPRTSQKVFHIPITWNQTRFNINRIKYRQARRLIDISINVQLNKQLKAISLRNIHIEKAIAEIHANITKRERKFRSLDHFIEIGSESLSNHFNKRMEKIRTVIKEQCSIIEKVLYEENEYWEGIYSVITSNDFPDFYRDENHLELSNDDLFPSVKQEWPQIHCSPEKSDHTIPSLDTYEIKAEESIDLSTLELSSNERAVSPIYSQPKFPAQLNFSPTILQDEQSQSIRKNSSPFDQLDETLESIEPMITLQRISHTFLLQYLNEDDIEHFDIQSKNYSQKPFVTSESICRPRTRSAMTNESQSINRTKGRKRNRSTSTNSQIKPAMINLRKRKSVYIIETNNKKQRNKRIKKNEISIREQTPSPTVDESKHYSTRFSTRFCRLENLSSSIIDTKNENYDNNRSKTRTRRWRKS